VVFGVSEGPHNLRSATSRIIARTFTMKTTSKENREEHKAQPAQSAPGAKDPASKQAGVAPGQSGKQAQAQQGKSSPQPDARKSATGKDAKNC
jgi:hypothetical protein